MIPSRILVIADEFDVHADVVERKIKASGGNSFRLNLNVEALRRTTIVSSNGVWSISAGNVECKEEEVCAVWPRRLTVSQTLEQQFEYQDSETRLWRSEWNRTLYGFYASIRDRYWFNAIASSNLADNKVYQTATARRCGLLVPEWIISNSRDALLDFAHDYDYVALKFMSQDMYIDDTGGFRGLYVNKLKESDLLEFGGTMENPVTLQRYVEKDFEVRYTVVEDKHFACAIHSQRSDRASTDWRRYDLPNTPHIPIEAPGIIRDQVSDLMRKLCLGYGALDFIVDRAGQWWFLEVNTAGQWLWIEDLAGLPISAEIARLLVARSKGEC